MIQMIKMEHWFDSEGWNIKDGVQDGRQLGCYELSDQKNSIKSNLIFDFLCMFRGLMMKTIKVKHCFSSEGWNS